MATLEPYSANRTAMAWPMPEVPPVTSTFLPFSPFMRFLPLVGPTSRLGAVDPIVRDGRGALQRPGHVTLAGSGRQYGRGVRLRGGQAWPVTPSASWTAARSW